ncbi:tyrosine-type recombinase/integrase [Caminicella sporogenes]|uniref:tyrosine-type recombinase/integrase n=1 Tax=Caminicella sporogenes TaxID=166485 RepID=UPI0025405257|nr:tyrosine-type recombinase/integrase [Caminicella sporogenes]WIF94289.1 tyrosine-type recombinase/integrase [Caminicella sporogenes]
MKIKMQKNFSDKTLKEGFNDFIKYCRIRNLSTATTNYYEMCFYKFTKFYSEDNLISTITKKLIDDYIIYLQQNTECNSVSINTHLRGLRVILYYFMKLEYIPEFKISLLKQQKKIKETYSDAELKLLLEKPNLKKYRFSEYRNWVIINYLLATGNRVNTIVNLKIKDLDFENYYIYIRTTKNKKQQIIPMSRKLANILIEYLQYREGEPDDYLFCNQHGQKLTTNALKLAIRKYNLKRGVMKTSIHLFRHTFAKKWIKAGGDIFRLQKILGHSSLDIVKEYVNMFNEDLVDDFDKLNALDQMSENKNYITLSNLKGGRK